MLQLRFRSERCAMFGSADSEKHALECLRLEADCRQLGARADIPLLKSHFVLMAAVWAALAESGPFDVNPAKPN